MIVDQNWVFGTALLSELTMIPVPFPFFKFLLNFSNPVFDSSCFHSLYIFRIVIHHWKKQHPKKNILMITVREYEVVPHKFLCRRLIH
jgi:hypothetical protein